MSHNVQQTISGCTTSGDGPIRAAELLSITANAPRRLTVRTRLYRQRSSSLTRTQYDGEDDIRSVGQGNPRKTSGPSNLMELLYDSKSLPLGLRVSQRSYRTAIPTPGRETFFFIRRNVPRLRLRWRNGRFTSTIDGGRLVFVEVTILCHRGVPPSRPGMMGIAFSGQKLTVLFTGPSCGLGRKLFISDKYPASIHSVFRLTPSSGQQQEPGFRVVLVCTESGQNRKNA